MLIQLTRRPEVGQVKGDPVVVNSDLIVSVTPAGEVGCTVLMAGGAQYQVSQLYDEVMDFQDLAHDSGVRKQQRQEREKARKEREAAKKKLLADNEAARAQAEAVKAQAASDKAQKEALRQAQVAKEAAAAAGVPYNPNVTPEGIDLTHPAPQPHQSAPVGTAPAVPPDAAEEEEGGRTKPAKGASHGTHHGTHKK